MKKFLCICISLALLTGIIPLNGVVLATDQPSDWAVTYVERANALGLIPAKLNSLYTQNITRAEFCSLAVPLYEREQGTITPTFTFSDTNDIDVRKIATIGVVLGVGDNRFDPDGEITRQESAVILCRLILELGKSLPTAANTFSDRDITADWATDYIGQIQAVGVMSGVGSNQFDPLGKYTREQSITTIVRVYDEVMGDAETGTLRDNVKVIDKYQSDLFIDQAEPVKLLDNGNMVIDLPSDFNGRTGDIFVIQPNEDNPYGFMGKVEGMNGNQIEVSQPYLDEVFEKIDVDINEDLKPEEIKSMSLEDGVTLDTSSYAAANSPNKYNVTYANYIPGNNNIQYSQLAFSPEIEIDIPKGTVNKMLFNLDLTIYDHDGDKGTTNDQIKLNGKLGYEDLKLDYDMDYLDGWDIHAAITGKEVSQIAFAAKGEYEISLAKLLNKGADGKVGIGVGSFTGVDEDDKIVLGSATWDIATMSVQAHGGEPMFTTLAVSLQFTTTISGKISGEIKIGYDYENVFKRGFKVEGTQFSEIKEDDPNSGIFIEGKATANAQATVGGDVVLYIMGCPLAKITNDVGAFAEAKGSIRFKTGEGVTGEGCAEFSVKAIGKFKGKYTVEFWWFGTKKLDLFNVDVTLYEKVIFGPWKWEQEIPTTKKEDITADLEITGDATNILSDNSILLCPAETWSNGSALFNDNLSDDFDISFDFKIGGGTGADGIVFAFFTKNLIPDSTGEYMMFNGNDGYGIEFDGYKNSNDSPNPHIALIHKEVSNHLVSVDDERAEDNAWHNVYIHVQGDNIVVKIDGDKIIDYTEKIDKTNKCMYFSASTGASTNNHYIRNVVLTAKN